ncbi:MAG: hypothetical protein Q9174_007319, partial [Haloplaca sp. 1 TL-2023]
MAVSSPTITIKESNPTKPTALPLDIPPYPSDQSLVLPCTGTSVATRSKTFRITRSITQGVQITTSDARPLYSITGFGSLHDPRMIITDPKHENNILANIITHTSSPSITVHVENPLLPVSDAKGGSKMIENNIPHTVTLHNRTHADQTLTTTLSNGKTYHLAPAHQSTHLASGCWADFHVRDAATHEMIAVFEVEWPESVDSIGTIKILTEDMGTIVETEVMFTILSVANREVAKAIMGMGAVVPM